MIFWPKSFLTRVKKYFWIKITKNLPKPSTYVYLGNTFSLFWLISYFWKFWPKKPKTKSLWPKFQFFLAKNVKFSKIRNSEPHPMNAGRFWCIVFVEVSELQAWHSVHACAPFCIGVNEASPFPLLYTLPRSYLPVSELTHSSTVLLRQLDQFIIIMTKQQADQSRWKKKSWLIQSMQYNCTRKMPCMTCKSMQRTNNVLSIFYWHVFSIWS